MPAPDPLDWSTWYLDEDDEMGEGRLQVAIVTLLLECLQGLARDRGWDDVVIDRDQFFAWIEREPRVRLAPDVYLLRNPPDKALVDSWMTWLPGHHPPEFALEIVSGDWRKDYHDNPAKYAHLGVQELVIFDPRFESRPAGGGLPFQVYRRDEAGDFVPMPAQAQKAWSDILGVYLLVVGHGESVRLRLSEDGVRPLPTPRQRERAETQRERTEKERERTEKERYIAQFEQERARSDRLLRLLEARGIDPSEEP